MKAVTSLAFGVLITTAPANPNYVNTVRQIQIDSGVEWDVTVAPVGEMDSREGVGPLGSNFELWTLSTNTGQATFLDSEFVSAFTPAGTIEIVTGDPYTVAPRTRVDKPFTVTRTVSGLINDPDTTISGKRVDYEHLLYQYPEGQHGFGGEIPAGTLFSAEGILSNGATSVSFAVSNLSGADLTQVEGEEVFSLYTVEDGEFASELLDEQTLTVWPVATATINGIEDGASYASIPPVLIDLQNLYPDSTTFVRIYQGEVSDNPTNPIEINDADLVIYDIEPQDRTLTLSSLTEQMDAGGVWTIEVLHRTPWGVERLAHASPELTNSLRVRAGLYSK